MGKEATSFTVMPPRTKLTIAALIHESSAAPPPEDARAMSLVMSTLASWP